MPFSYLTILATQTTLKKCIQQFGAKEILKDSNAYLCKICIKKCRSTKVSRQKNAANGVRFGEADHPGPYEYDDI